MERALQHRCVHDRLYGLWTLASTAAAREQHEWKVGPGWLIGDRLRKLDTIEAVKSLIGNDRARRMAFKKSVEQKFTGAVDDRFEAGAGEQLVHHFGVPSLRCDDKKRLHVAIPRRALFRVRQEPFLALVDGGPRQDAAKALEPRPDGDAPLPDPELPDGRLV